MLFLIHDVEWVSDVCVCDRTLLKWMHEVYTGKQNKTKKPKPCSLFLLNAVKSKVGDFILAEFYQVQKMERGINPSKMML